MSTPSFPYSTLGSPIASGYKITRNATRSRVDTTCGIPFQHTRTSGSIFEIDATWSLGLSQYAAFSDWYRTDVKDGTIEFTIDGMVLNGDQTTITARFAKPYKETDNGYGGRNVSVTLETGDADYISEATLDAALPAEPHTDAVTWPASLFGGVLQDWSESPASNDFRGDVRGFALDYRKRKSNLVLTVADISFSMSNDSKKLFDAWYHYKLKDGAGWFWLWCEIRGVWKYAKVRFVDEVSMSYRAVSRWDVTGTIETVDAQYWDLSDCQDLVPHNNETKPTITQQSEGGAYLAGETVNLFVVASGTQPITYQWYLDGEPISGATSAEYSFTMSEAYEGSYTCVVSNALGSDTSDVIYTELDIKTLIYIQVNESGNIVDKTGNGTVAISGTVIVDTETTHDGYGSIRNTSHESGIAAGYVDISCNINVTDFTVEGWIYCIGYGDSEYHTPLITTNKPPSGFSGVFIRGRVYNSENQINYGPDYLNGGAYLRSNGIYELGAWIHVAVVHSGTTLYLFKNGTIVDSGTDESWNFTTKISHIYLGMGIKYDDSQILAPNCWENVIVSNYAKYISDFVPSNRP